MGRDLCRTSYFQQSGLTVPCMWSGTDCLANFAGAVSCVGFSCPLQASRASYPSLVEARASSPPEALSVVASMLLEMRSLRSRTEIRSEDERIVLRPQHRRRLQHQTKLPGAMNSVSTRTCRSVS